MPKCMKTNVSQYCQFLSGTLMKIMDKFLSYFNTIAYSISPFTFLLMNMGRFCRLHQEKEVRHNLSLPTFPKTARTSVSLDYFCSTWLHFCSLWSWTLGEKNKSCLFESVYGRPIDAGSQFACIKRFSGHLWN